MKLPASSCPFCKAPHNMASAANGSDDVPKPKDISICIRCGEILVFSSELRLRKPSRAEYLVIGFDPDIRRARKAWLEMRRTLGLKAGVSL